MNLARMGPGRTSRRQRAMQRLGRSRRHAPWPLIAAIAGAATALTGLFAARRHHVAS
jgi:hypothetical protein